MRLSSLQHYIIKEIYRNERHAQTDFLDFYRHKKMAAEVALKDINRSLDRLVSRDILRAQGVKTAKKWYTKSVVLTAKGRQVAKKLLSNQAKLPFNK